MSLMDALIYGVRDVLQQLTLKNRRSRLNFGAGFTITEDEANDCNTVTTSAAFVPTGTGIPHIVANVEQATATLIVNADVSASAAIAGSKINPAFGASARVNARHIDVYNAAGTFVTTLDSAAIAANRVITMPLLAGDDTMVTEAFAQTLTNKTLSAPTVTGTVTYQGTRLRILSIPGEVQTSDATVTTVASFAMSDETSCAFDVIVTASRQTNVTKCGRWKRSALYSRTSAGAPTLIGAIETGTDEETDAAWDVTLDVSSNTVRVRVTGAAATALNWTCELRVQETLATP